MFTEGALKIVRRLKDYGGEATCKQLSVKYGESSQFYLSGSVGLAKRVVEKTGCPVLTDDNENPKWWPVLYVGHNAGKDEDGSFIWRLRDELAEALDMSEDKVMEIMQIAREPASLETPIGEEDDSNLGDFVADSNVVTPEGNVESVMLREHIDALLGDLKERERQVIVLRFGLEDGHPRTLEEVGQQFNVTRERIRQIEAKALRKLRHPNRSNKVRDYLD